jgi:hypothetical protein
LDQILRELKIVMAELIIAQREKRDAPAGASQQSHHSQQPFMRLLSPATRSSVFIKTRQAFEGIIPRNEPKQLQLDTLLAPRQGDAKKAAEPDQSGSLFEKIVCLTCKTRIEL